MKLKYLSLMIILGILSGYSQSISAQEGGMNEKNAADIEKKDLSYFSQEEMQFILGDKDQPWNYGRISIAPYYLIGLGDLSPIIPYITGFVFIFDHGIHHAFKPYYRKKSPLLPGLRFEAAFNIYGPLSINSLSISGGLLWLFPINSGRGGEIVLSSTAGMNFMRGQVGEYYYVNDSLYVTATLGYGLSFSRIFLSLESRFTYIYDDKFPLMGVGGMLGVGYRFPAVAASEQNGGEK